MARILVGAAYAPGIRTIKRNDGVCRACLVVMYVRIFSLAAPSSFTIPAVHLCKMQEKKFRRQAN